MHTSSSRQAPWLHTRGSGAPRPYSQEQKIFQSVCPLCPFVVGGCPRPTVWQNQRMVWRRQCRMHLGDLPGQVDTFKQRKGLLQRMGRTLGMEHLQRMRAGWGCDVLGYACQGLPLQSRLQRKKQRLHQSRREHASRCERERERGIRRWSLLNRAGWRAHCSVLSGYGQRHRRRRHQGGVLRSGCTEQHPVQGP